MKQVLVELGERAYPIYIGPGLLQRAGELLAERLTGPVLVVTNTVVRELHLQRLLEGLADVPVETLTLEDGERHKTLDAMNAIITRLLELRYGRDCALVALGGGVVGDVTGFAAACYQRGVSYAQAPTTLLAQVDSSVGGKTAVNHRLGKNMIGAFHQPVAVLSDAGALVTLPAREFRAGLAEIVKYGVINDAPFFGWLEENMAELLQREPACLTRAIELSCRNKADITARDERESGLRALLNFGHTFGHALETALNYETLLHGEAVAVGMAMAADLSVVATGLPAADAERIKALLRRAELPVSLPEAARRAPLRALMSVDKKAQQGRLRLVLLQALGKAIVTADFNEADLAGVIARYGD